MSSTAPSIATVCIHCGGREADAQTGRCLKCGKVAISPQILDEFAHPFERRTSESRHSPSAAYRANATKAAEAPKPAEAAASSMTPSRESAGSSASVAEPSNQAPPDSSSDVPVPAPETPDPSNDQQTAAAELPHSFEEQPSLSFVLPDSRETTSWLSKTKAVRDQLLTRADKAEAQIAELKAEADRCRHTAAAFTSLLGQLTVAGESETPPPSFGGSPGAEASGQVVEDRGRVHRLREVRRAALR